MWLLALDDFSLADYGIPPAMLTNKSSALGFGVDRRSGIYGSVFFGAQSQPASWNVIFQCPDEASRYALIALLAAPRSDQVRLLVKRDAAGTDLITAEAAISGVEKHGSSDNLEVTFSSNDSVWLGETVAATSKAFASALDQMVHVPVGGNVPTYATIRVTPTVQRVSATANVGWKYRQRWTITNNGGEALFRYPVRISLGSTTAIVSGGKALASGNDLRVWLDGLEQSRTLLTWNTVASFVWVIIPALPVGQSLTYDVVYGNASAGSPPVLAYPDLPAFELALSSNSSWVYRTQPGATYAGRGMWSLSAGTGSFFADYSVPGAWYRLLVAGDDASAVEQRARHQVYGTARFGVVRGGGETYDAAAIGLTGKDTYDTVVLSHPLGITTLTSAFSYIAWSYAMVTQTVTTVVGTTSTSSDVEVKSYQDPTMFRLVIAGRNSDTEDWAEVYTRAADTEISPGSKTFDYVNIASAAYTINAKHVAIGVWTQSADYAVQAANQQGYFYAVSYSDTTVGINSALLVIAQTQAETQIYELATELRLGGGANAVGPYHTLLIGNARGASGAGTPRAALAYGTQALQVDCEAHTHTLWNTTFTSKAEALSAHAVRAMAGYLHDGVTGEIATAQWLPLTVAARTVPNSAFATDLASWELESAGAGLTYTATRDGTIGGAANGSLKVAITANTGTGDLIYRTVGLFPVSGAEREEITAWVRTSHANVHPRLAIYWYQEGTPNPVWMATATSPDWSPVANTAYTIAFAAAVPDGATRFRIAVVADTAVSAAIGNAWFDDIRLNDSDLVVADVAMGTIAVDVLVRPRWVP